ncbi:MAG: hypothetical protein LC123_02355 [Burkholderiales bacterium]|nr:hypothetical protein [Burkholderiales bacterium]
MAVAPLFVADMVTLKTGLRLKDARAEGALAIIDQAVMDVRLGFYRKLGASRVTELLDTASTDAPTTDAEVMRMLANSTETKWVRQLLLRRLPTMFADAAGGRQQAWNEEGAFEATPERRLKDEIDRLEAEVEDALETLKGNTDLNDRSSVQVSTIGPSETPDLPGASIWKSRRLSSQWGEREGS